MTPEDRAAKVMERWHRQVVDTTTPFSGDEVLARDIAEAIREAVADRVEWCARYFEQPGIVGMWRANEIAAVIRVNK